MSGACASGQFRIAAYLHAENHSAAGETGTGSSQQKRFALRKWLLAMTLDMLCVGIMVGGGLWLAGAPFPFPLAVLSGVSVFVPYVGPILAILPGLLLALSVSPHLALLAAIVYTIAWQFESNVTLPLLQAKTVHMPPVVSLLAIVAFGLLFGIWGVLLATPLAVVTMTIVRMAYVEDFLEKKARD